MTVLFDRHGVKLLQGDCRDVVACVRVMPEKDRLLLEAATTIEHLAMRPWIGECQACGHEHEAPNAKLSGVPR